MTAQQQFKTGPRRRTGPARQSNKTRPKMEGNRLAQVPIHQPTENVNPKYKGQKLEAVNSGNNH